MWLPLPQRLNKPIREHVSKITPPPFTHTYTPSLVFPYHPIHSQPHPPEPTLHPIPLFLPPPNPLTHPASTLPHTPETSPPSLLSHPCSPSLVANYSLVSFPLFLSLCFPLTPFSFPGHPSSNLPPLHYYTHSPCSLSPSLPLPFLPPPSSVLPPSLSLLWPYLMNIGSTLGEKLILPACLWTLPQRISLCASVCVCDVCV